MDQVDFTLLMVVNILSCVAGAVALMAYGRYWKAGKSWNTWASWRVVIVMGLPMASLLNIAAWITDHVFLGGTAGLFDIWLKILGGLVLAFVAINVPTNVLVWSRHPFGIPRRFRTIRFPAVGRYAIS